MTQVIYKQGELRIQTVLTEDGKNCKYSGEPVETALQKLDGASVMSLDDAVALIEVEQDKTLIKGWHEMTEEEYWDALEALPPQNWRTVKGVNIFQCSEYWTSNITQHCARLKGRYFSALRRTTTSYEQIADEIAKEVSK